MAQSYLYCIHLSSLSTLDFWNWTLKWRPSIQGFLNLLGYSFLTPQYLIFILLWLIRFILFSCHCFSLLMLTSLIKYICHFQILMLLLSLKVLNLFQISCFYHLILYIKITLLILLFYFRLCDLVVSPSSSCFSQGYYSTISVDFAHLMQSVFY